MAGLRQAFVGAGANLGDRHATIGAAMEQLRATPGVATVVTSPVFETDPVGLADQPLFLNLVAGLEVSLTPEELLDAVQRIEAAFGRVRTQRWGPRTLDLDLLAFEGETRASLRLQLPHPRMLERGFVTVPLRELLQRAPFRDNAEWGPLRAKVGAAASAQGSGVRRCPAR